MKRILYLSFYFEPDLCAGSFRNSPLVKELAKQLNGIAIIDVITTMPNRYSSFNADCPENESIDNINIQRILLPSHKSGFLDQVLSFKRYYTEVKRRVAKQEYDLVFASSSRLFTAFLGMLIAKRKNKKLYLDIRDIFADTLKDVIPNKVVKLFLLPILNFVEQKTFSYASHINLISAGFTPYFKKYPNVSYSFFTNGIDKEFIMDELFEESLNKSVKVITYAGNIGEGQGLHKVIPEAAFLLGASYQFRIIGDGGAKQLLLNELTSRQVTNVSIENPVKRSEIIKAYKSSHFLLMHLNDYEAFKKVLPSKVFELGAFPRPILAGVNGYAREFINDNLSDAILFHPANPVELAQKVKSFNFKIIQREKFIQQFGRQKINHEMANSIVSYL